MVNGVPYKPGSWDDNEDELLAHYQKEFGNRCTTVHRRCAAMPLRCVALEQRPALRTSHAFEVCVCLVQSHAF